MNYKDVLANMVTPEWELPKLKKERLEMEKPQWILDIERTTGLRCEYNRKAFATDYWNVLAPTGMKLFEVYSTSDTEIGGCRWPGLYTLVGRE